ncbi:MAG: YwaF family protein [Lachnospiraceae bacterium]|nr:YwaF family protein [Lachnospiraceae bacterium]
MSGPSDFWIITPFNPLFIILFLFFLLLLAAAGLLLKNKSRKTRETVLVAACIVTLIGYLLYKHFLSLDSDYSLIITDYRGGFSWWGELPLQLCNINMIIIPIAVLRKSRPLMSFAFFMAPLGALMALVMPGNGFDGYSLFLPRIMGYYGTHFMIVIEGLALAVFGLYRPRFRDLPRTVVTIILVTFVVFLFNLLLRATGIYPKANYFFSMETEGNALLNIFYRLIPVPFLYLMPSILILAVYMPLVTLPFELAERRKSQTS